MSTIDLALIHAPIEIQPNVSYMPARTIAYPNIMYEMAIILDEDQDLRIIQRLVHIANELYKQKYRITIKAATERKGSMMLILDTTLRRTPSFKEQKEITDKLRVVCENAGYDGDPWDLTVYFMDINSNEICPDYENTIKQLCKRSDIGIKLLPLMFNYPFYIIDNIEYREEIEIENRVGIRTTIEKIKAGI